MEQLRSKLVRLSHSKWMLLAKTTLASCFPILSVLCFNFTCLLSSILHMPNYVLLCQSALGTMWHSQRHSARANREDLVAESSAQKTSAREQARLERQRKMAETLREKVVIDLCPCL
jgi:hypothetical protein